MSVLDREGVVGLRDEDEPQAEPVAILCRPAR
jgi:hypothetical protein